MGCQARMVCQVGGDVSVSRPDHQLQMLIVSLIATLKSLITPPVATLHLIQVVKEVVHQVVDRLRSCDGAMGVDVAVDAEGAAEDVAVSVVVVMAGTL
ncbi:uncharacterized protein DS421_4g121310 [Arachis hypogaea]|nr:uncharacterized protein DS421_4g121310 [Arachis hypogaea]